MSKPNLLFYANKLGGREIGLIFFAHYYKEQGFCETFVEILGIDIKGDVIMDLKMKYIILYVEKFEECLKFYKDILQLP
ncbi:hypothetical protein P4408_26400, partial [Bacillus thuringiensis]